MFPPPPSPVPPVGAILGAIRALAGSPALRERRRAPGGIRLMEVCGGQTHAILRHDLAALLPEGISFLHGPGCPVCVTPGAFIDRAIAAALSPARPVLCSYGDLLRVPSATGATLARARAAGADVRIVTSPLQALGFARLDPSRPVLFLAIGFETTAPANALPLKLARENGIVNFALLASQFLIPPVLRHLFAGAPATDRPDALLAPGHVAAVTGAAPFRALSAELRLPVAVTGFTPAEILLGVRAALAALAGEAPSFANAYPAVVSESGNLPAQAAMREVFAVTDAVWRGLGPIPASGLAPRPDFCQGLAKMGEICQTLANPPADAPAPSPADCPAGDILSARRLPPSCPHFATACTSDHPLGAPMVSPEGACAAYFLHRRPGACSGSSRPAPAPHVREGNGRSDEKSGER